MILDRRSEDGVEVAEEQENGSVRTRAWPIQLILDNFVWLLVFSLLIVALITTPSFFEPDNLVNLLVQSGVLAMLVLAETICLIAGYFDMSIESTLIFTSVFTAWLVAPHPAASGLGLNPVLGMAAMLLTGALIGAINGLLIAYIKMNAFITTLAMSIILIGSCVTLSQGNTLGPFPRVFEFFGDGSIGPVPTTIVVFASMYLIFNYILKNTPFGRKLYAVGGNRNAAQASGINTKRMVLLAYVLSGLISAVGGLVLSGRLGAAVSHMTRNNLLYAFAAAVIGGVSPFGGEGRIGNVFGGVILLMIVNKLLIIAHVDPFLITSTSGVIIFIAMLIMTIKQKRFAET
jgi:ribose/xylose/arabinose/galactoside ABC-type transport system permease subunit